VTTTADDLPDDIAALQAALTAERARAARVEAELAVAKARASDDQALIAYQRLQIEKLTRQIYGPRSEHTVRLLDQIELAFEELESSATEDEIAAERAVARTTNVLAFTRKRPARQPFPEHRRASGCSSRGQRNACAAAARGCASWVRTSPRRWRSSHGSGR
jgi:transposase